VNKLDKYTYNIKAEKIQKLVDRGDYETAARVCDTIDWSQIRSVRMLATVAVAYEKVKNYDAAIDILLMAYEEAPVGRRILYKLTVLAIAAGNHKEAEEFYKSYLKEAPQDNARFLLRYLLADVKGESLDKKIAILEAYKRQEFEEEWAYQLAELYHKANMRRQCVSLCDEIILWFGVGSYVDKAMELKEFYEPLSAEQRHKRDQKALYEENLKKIAAESEAKAAAISKPKRTVLKAEVKEQEVRMAEEYKDELPKVEISDETDGLYVRDFDESAFVGEEIEEEYHDGSEQMGETREVVPQRMEETRIFQAVRRNTVPVPEAGGNPFAEQEEEAAVGSLTEELPPIVFTETDNTAPEEADEDLPEGGEETLPDGAEAIEPKPEDNILEESFAEPSAEEEYMAEQLKFVWEDSEAEVFEEVAMEPEPEPEPEVKPEHEFLFVGAPSSAEGINMAVDALRKAYDVWGGEISQVAKISGSKLNQRGLIRSLPNLQGKDLIIDGANALSDEILDEIEQVRKEIDPEKYFVLLDRPVEIYRLKERLGQSPAGSEAKNLSDDFWNTDPEEAEPQDIPEQIPDEEALPQIQFQEQPEPPTLKKETKKEAKPEQMPVVSKPVPEPEKAGAPTWTEEEEDRELSEEEFAAHVKFFAAELECVIDELGMLAVYKEMEAIKEEGDPLTKSEAEELIEDAADAAERFSFAKLFRSGYDSEGRLILKEKHFR